MTIDLPFLPRRAHLPLAGLALALLAAFALMFSGVLQAQVEGDRGIAPTASNGDIEIGGIEVDVRADNAGDARRKGWREAVRKGWEELGGPPLADGALEGLVSAVVVEQESIGPRRYIATLGVVFDRSRAGQALGASGQRARSAPMLVLPVLDQGGARTMFETRNPWQLAWAEMRTGAVAIDYVRPSGAGAESLLLNAGQTERRSRVWWRNILDQFGAADVLIPVADLQRQYPGGPVEGTFTARYGPDSTYLGSFSLKAKNDKALRPMLDEAIKRLNVLYTQALRDGRLRPDPTLNTGGGEMDPAIARLASIGQQIEAQERARAAAARAAVEPTRATPRESERNTDSEPTPSVEPTNEPIATYTVQFASADEAAIDSTLGAVRSVSGVRSASINSRAVGGTSVMLVTYQGDISSLAAALRGRGFSVTQGAGALSIRR